MIKTFYFISLLKESLYKSMTFTLDFFISTIYILVLNVQPYSNLQAEIWTLVSNIFKHITQNKNKKDLNGENLTW